MAVNSQLLQRPGARMLFPKRPSRISYREAHPFLFKLKKPEVKLASKRVLKGALLGSLIVFLIGQATPLTSKVSLNFKNYFSKNSVVVTSEEAKAKFDPRTAVYSIKLQPPPLFLIGKKPASQSFNVLLTNNMKKQLVYDLAGRLENCPMIREMHVIKLEQFNSSKGTLYSLKQTAPQMPSDREVFGFPSKLFVISQLSIVFGLLPVFAFSTIGALAGLIMGCAYVIGRTMSIRADAPHSSPRKVK
ncbi:MAG: hypothetical protein ABIH99_05755 [Candidatus Micrarchaeota archaeon]